MSKKPIKKQTAENTAPVDGIVEQKPAEKPKPKPAMCETCTQLGFANVPSSGTLKSKPLCDKHTAEAIKAEDYSALKDALTSKKQDRKVTFLVISGYFKKYGGGILKHDMDEILREKKLAWVPGVGYRRDDEDIHDATPWQEQAEARADERADEEMINVNEQNF